MSTFFSSQLDMILFEFARLEGIRLGLKFPGRWIYLPLLLMVALGAYLSGVDGANTIARYTIGLTGAGATAFVLALHRRSASPAEKRWIGAAVLGFSLYGIAAGLIVPPVHGWGGDFFNYNAFGPATEIPIQFVPGVLACWLPLAIWGWGQRLARDLASVRYTKFLHRQFVWT